MPRYLTDGAKKLQYETDRINREVDAPNRSYLLGFRDNLELTDRKERTQERRLMELRTICKLGICKDLKKINKEQVEEVVRQINKLKVSNTGKDVADYSKSRTKRTFKSFIIWLTGSDKHVSWIKTSSKGSNKLPEELLTEEDVGILLNATTNQRDKTILALLWDAGMRAGELENLKLSSFMLSGATNYVIVNGKTGVRRTPLSVSVPYISAYINQYRKNAMADEPFFMSLNNKVPLEYDALRKMLEDVKKRANRNGTVISKRIHSHLFRYSRCVYLHKNGMPAKAIELFFGWSSLKMVDHYSKLSGADVDSAFYRALGMKEMVEPQTPKLIIKMCLRCHSKNETTSRNCSNCGFDLDKTVFEQLEDYDNMQKKMKKLEHIVEGLYSQLPENARKEIG